MDSFTYDNSKRIVTNGHGDIIEIRDSSGALLNQYQYDIWGNEEVKEEKVHNPFRYSGELWDDTTELQYLRARWYDPDSGRFINEDTYEGENENPSSLNLYTYVQNNPLIYIDPSGHTHMAGAGGGGLYYSVATSEDTMSIINARGASNGVKNQLLGQLLSKHSKSMFGYALSGEMTQNQFKYLFGLATNQTNPGSLAHSQ
nr:RHS repeat-associated core domain-containing protein [Paenibacillus kribbensis]